MIEIFATHGVVESYRENRFEHKNLLDIDQFSAFLQSTQKFVSVAEALQGHGKALTIDDATVASGRAAMLARDFGHEVTLFINPWHIEDGRPYWASRMDGLIDRIDLDNLLWDGREFHLNTFEGKYEFRMHFKNATRRQRTPEENNALIERIEKSLGVNWVGIPSHMRCLTLKEVQELRDNGVSVENHYWTHLDPAVHGPAQFADEFHKAKKWLLETLGITSKLFASPFGEFLPPSEFLQQNETVCLLLHNDLPPGVVKERIVNRITLDVRPDLSAIRDQRHGVPHVKEQAKAEATAETARAEVDAVRAAQAKAEAAAEAARAEIDALRAAQAKAEAAAEAARAEVDALRESTSWRITGPLRSIAERLRK